MAKLVFSLVFLLALTLSVHTVLGTFQTAEYLLNKFKEAASGMEGAAQDLSNNAVEIMDDAKDSTGSWSHWAKTKIKGLGGVTTQSTPPQAEAPVDSTVPPSDIFSDSTGSAGYGPAGAPLAY